MAKVTPVILCGGSGTRLWPLSRAGFPKQFLVLSGTKSLFQQAVERVNNISSDDITVGETLVVTGEEHRFIALDQLREIPTINAKLILEPKGKNTAPALTLAALHALANGDDPVLVVTPADQTIQNFEAFDDAMRRSIEVAESGAIVILGIKPTAPETGFGYIKKIGNVGNFGEFEVAEFVEKPDLKTAESYFLSGDYSWNGGMFVVRASVWIRALKLFRKDILTSTENAFNQSSVDQQFIRPNSDLFIDIPSESVDCAVIEKCPGSEFEIKVIPLDAAWNDLGSWNAVWDVSLKDISGNTCYGDVLIRDSQNTIVHATHRLVSVLGVEDLIIVETPDALLIANKNSAQQVKYIVSELEENGREEHLIHRKVSRPWGWYDSIDTGKQFKVKRIQVDPGQSLSLQQHQYRSEHWVVVRGRARVICGEKTINLEENQSTYIPKGEKHRLSNMGDLPLELIEIQTGVYLGEDDILRFEDNYGRFENES